MALKPFYNKKMHLGMSGDNVKKALISANMIYNIPDSARALIVGDMTSLITQAITNGSSFTSVDISGSEETQNHIKQVASNIVAGVNVTVFPQDGIACKAYTANIDELTETYEYAADFITIAASKYVKITCFMQTNEEDNTVAVLYAVCMN